MASPSARTFTLPADPRPSGRDATEQRILDATYELLAGGASLARLSVSRIAEAAGVSRATFYLHFPDKRELVARLAERHLSEFSEITNPFLESGDAGRDQLVLVIRALVENWRTHAGVLAGLIELAAYDEGAREAWSRVVRNIAASITQGLRRFRPDLDEARAETLGELIAWMGERACHQMVGVGADERDVERVADALTEAVWRIIAPVEA